MDDLDSWPDALQAVIAESGVLKRVFVLRETDSTQDAARRMTAAPGDVVIAGRQTLGRGRLGRTWADTQSHGLAVTFVLEPGAAERLLLASAVAAACAAEALLPAQTIGIKWPNDIIVNERKVAGILVEQSSSRACIGVGMNVTQRTWPRELEGIAASMAQLGSSATRLDAASALLRFMSESLTKSDDELIAEFTHRDALCGRHTTFRTGGAIVAGIVREVHPLTGLLVETEAGEMRLPPQTTTIVKA